MYLSLGKTCYSEEQVISMLEFLIDNIFVSFGGTLFQQVVGIPMGTICTPLLADLFLYSYELEFQHVLPFWILFEKYVEL
jgi:hypothetical protein